MFQRVIPYSLFLVSFFHLAASQQHHLNHLSSLPSVSSRAAFPRDVSGNWTFIYSEGETKCPRSIRHLGFNRRRKGPIRVFHHRIIQDGVRCKNNRKRKGRRFRIFHSDDVRTAFKNRTTPYHIPNRLVKLLKTSGPIRRAFRAANKLAEGYFIGFESRSRVCDDKRFFRRGTTAFLFRPNSNALIIKGLDVSLTPGKRYLLMIPRFKRTTCVYSSELREKELNATASAEDTESSEEASGEGSSEDESGNELEASTDSRSCFPATASVLLEDGRKVFMKDLSIQDSVQVGANQYAKVFMFTHRLHAMPSIFRRIVLDSGEEVEVTGGHYVYSNGKLVTASQLRLGDMMPLVNGTQVRVKALYNVAGMGLYNPQTTHGDIVVNGIRVSTYTDAIKPPTAHSFLAPFRAAFKFLNIDLSFGYFNRGAGIFQSSQVLLR